MIWSCELMISLCVAEELVFPLCNGTHLLGSPWQEGGREQAAFLPGRLTAFAWQECQERAPFPELVVLCTRCLWGCFPLFSWEGVASSSHGFHQ